MRRGGVIGKSEPEVAAVILYKSGICDFGQKCMSQMARVVSNLASPPEARAVSLGRHNISGAPHNTKARSCHNNHVQKWKL